MIIVPVYDLILFQDVDFYFRNDVYEKWNLKELSPGDEVLFLLLRTQKDLKEAQAEDFYPIGYTAKLVSTDAEGLVQMRVHSRVDVADIENEDGTFTATAAVRPSRLDLSEEEIERRFSALKEDYLQFISEFQWGVWVRSVVIKWTTMEDMLCSSAAYLDLSWEDKYALMAIDSVKERYDAMERVIRIFFESSRVKESAQNAQKEAHEKAYREMALKKQIDHLQKELEELHPDSESEIQKYERLIAESGMNETAQKEAEKVLRRMKQEGQDGHEYGLLSDYLDFVTSLCWKKMEAEPINLKKVREVLEEDHYGLKKVKDRVVEQMAVMALSKKQAGSILLFVGPPGTGKTSIGASIARALERKYVRVSLGGIRDEAEIRGHRRTYVGAMPGRIMDGIKRSGVSNPVVVLDEVDKLIKDITGDPSSALLEVLDPEQNHTFTDHYMNVPYDLSDVLFICTANNADTIPDPLRNRMELIRFSGYTAAEKEKIAKKHLLPEVMKDAGITGAKLKVSDKAIQSIIENYTAESGVRTLKRSLAALCRHTAVLLAEADSDQEKEKNGKDKAIKVSVGVKNLKEFLGEPLLHHDRKLQDPLAGVATGLAWTSAGGEVLFIESRIMPGSGKLIITGQLGDVMKESVQIALSLVKSLYPKQSKVLETSDLHLHVPAGAVPKDGPSAGITITTCIASALTGRKVDADLAMTGEVSLRGNVLPIGGLPEKLMAAVRAGITKVLVPYANRNDVAEVPEEIRAKIEVKFVKMIDEVLERALLY